jgi:radical SAM protein with 4Fe4S-binding SPASM domain
MCPYPDLAERLPMGRMDWGLYEKIVDDFGDICRRKGFSGKFGFCVMGEPFIERDIARYVRKAREHPFRLNFTTNGALMTPDIVDSLIAAGYSGSFNVSCHGISEDTVKRVMGLDAGLILQNVDYLLSRYPKDRVEVTAIAQNWPRGEAARVRKYWRERGVRLRSPLAGSRAGLIESGARASIAALAGCRAKRPLYHMAVAFNGDVVLCCNDMARRVVVGNLREQGIEEVWNSELFRMHVEMVYGNLEAPADYICRSCEWAMGTSRRLDGVTKELRRGLARAGMWFRRRNAD